MTREELEKEAEGYTNKLLEDWELYDPEALQEAYIAGAEPREKRIAELIALINAERERQEKCDDIHLREIAELEKENAELKEKNKWYSEQVCYKECAEEWGKLTKAKEHIENLLYYVKQCTCERSNYAEIEEDIKEAEQFLKDSEVEK